MSCASLVYEVVEYHTYKAYQEFGRDKESTAKRVQEPKVRVTMHQEIEGY
jgi:hypothetical protein